MKQQQIFWLVVSIFAVMAVISFILSASTPIFNAIAFAFVTIVLGMLSWQSIKKYKANKGENRKSTIDEMLAKDEGQVPKQNPKKTLSEKSESFSNGLVPLALVFFTICSLCLFIALI